MTYPAFLGAFASPQDFPSGYDRLYVCVGRSNVGKSSFVNAFTNSSISRVSATPGRTQTLNAFAVAPRTLFVDLPGYGYAKYAKSLRETLEERIYETLTQLKPDRVFVVIDAYVGITALDREMIAFLAAEQQPFTILANKVDRLNQKERYACEKAIREEFGGDIPTAFISAEKRTGIAEVRSLMLG
jgi:GTP-binding protein